MSRGAKAMSELFYRQNKAPLGVRPNRAGRKNARLRHPQFSALGEATIILQVNSMLNQSLPSFGSRESGELFFAALFQARRGAS